MLVFLCACVAFGCCALWKNMEGASHHIWNDPFTDTTLHRIRYPSPQLQTWSRRMVFTTANFSSSQFFHARREEFSPFSFVGPGTTNCVHYRQNFILSDFSSSHRRVFSNVWPGTTSYICYFSVMTLGTHNHNPHPPTTQHLPSSKHHSSILGPGTTNCVGYRQNFILSDFFILSQKSCQRCVTWYY